MGQVATLLLLMAACAFGLYKLLRAERRAAAERARVEAEKAKRKEQEKELLERLGKLKEKKDDLQATKDAINRDPKRAAKVLSKMMRSKD